MEKYDKVTTISNLILSQRSSKLPKIFLQNHQQSIDVNRMLISQLSPEIANFSVCSATYIEKKT